MPFKLALFLVKANQSFNFLPLFLHHHHVLLPFCHHLTTMFYHPRSASQSRERLPRPLFSLGHMSLCLHDRLLQCLCLPNLLHTIARDCLFWSPVKLPLTKRSFGWLAAALRTPQRRPSL